MANSLKVAGKLDGSTDVAKRTSEKKGMHPARNIYPTRLKIWFRTEAKAPAIGAIKPSPLLEIGARLDRPIPGLWRGLKSKFSIALGIKYCFNVTMSPCKEIVFKAY